MSAVLAVRVPGPYSTIQDLGRFGYQHAGIPVSGALDAVALRLANQLVGNPEGTACLEILFQGPTLTVEADSVRLAAAGAPLEILGDAPRTVGPWRSVRLERGETLRVGAPANGATAYLAVEGGFALAPVLGSLSTYVRGGFGGFEGRPLAAGDLLPLVSGACESRDERELPRPELPQPERFRIVLGPQNDLFTDTGLETLLTAAFEVSPASDRMGMRLDGPAVALLGSHDLVSDGIAPGAIQVPGSGQPIVLLADRQTTGGYPKIATVIAADLPALGRLPPGAAVAFEAVTLAEAAAARSALARRLAELAAGIAPVKARREPRHADLVAANLVSGVVDGTED